MLEKARAPWKQQQQREMSHILDRGTSREGGREDVETRRPRLLLVRYYSCYTDIMRNALRSVSLWDSHTACDLSRDPRESRPFSFLPNHVSNHVPSLGLSRSFVTSRDFRYCLNEALFSVQRPSRPSLIATPVAFKLI